MPRLQLKGMFGLTAPTLKVRLVATGSSWDDDNNEIKLTLGGWWGVRAHSIIHHEYGHALHDLRLGGLPNLYNNECNPHAPGVITTYRCAFVEGFAEFFAEASGAAEPSWPLEPQQYYAPAPEGLKSEGAFAGFLLDIWDEAVEPWDGISYPGSWMAAVLRDCSIQWGGFWYSPHVPHWLASCMEDSTTAYGEGWFPLLEIPSAIITAQKPSGWSAAAVRSAYLHNFFNNTKD